jgi:MoCo/4Fe-4S cofactor protein with predicted Tat translocation signal
MSPLKTDAPPAQPRFWRSLNELENTPEFQQHLAREFPYLEQAEASFGFTRRDFLKLMGASLALGGLTGCRRPVNKIVPYVKQPEDVIPGKPLYYATTMPFGEEAFGVVAESHEGRPTRLDGNELHPATMGRSSVFIQGAVLEFYDPTRAKDVVEHANGGSKTSTRDTFVAAWRQRLSLLEVTNGEGLVILSEPFASPTTARQKAELQRRFPAARWVAYAPVANEALTAGVEAAAGLPLRALYHFDQADVVVALDSDFMQTENDAVRQAADYAKRRQQLEAMNRLFVAESNFSSTGSMADHRVRVKPSQIAGVLVALAKALALPVGESLKAAATTVDATWVKAAAEDLMQARGKGLVIVGRYQPAPVQTLALAINAALGNLGKTVTLVQPTDNLSSSTTELATLTADMAAGKVKSLIILGGNPAYHAPADLKFAEALTKVEMSVYLGLYLDETAKLATWHLPACHFLEAWGDARGWDGTASVVQPLLAPLYPASISQVELLGLIITGTEPKGYDEVRQTWNGLLAGTFEAGWRQVLHDGVFAGSAFTTVPAAVDLGRVAGWLGEQTLPASTGMEVQILPSPTLYDGRYANLGWLQETPQPMTKLTWDNAALMSPATAKALGVKNNYGKIGRQSASMVTLVAGERSLRLPALLLPGHADDVITVHLGYGRQLTGIAEGVGGNANVLRTVAAPALLSDVHLVVSVEELHELAVTQDHNSMENRAIVREASVEDYLKEGHEALKPTPPHVLRDETGKPAGIYTHPLDLTKGYQWGMTIDLNTCTGCNACLVACQSENNIPVVGKDRVMEGREMHWIRLDRYFNGDEANPQAVHQPVPCMHCENAPCEEVCPVAATVHDKEGLNVMAYNRCIGTRYCSNNCPYKVRRFNFFNYTNAVPETEKMQKNPDVTLRFRGVMEKCTYCTQRISEGRIQAKLENRHIRDGEVKTACQQACPVGAITFGNINDPTSQVSQMKAEKRNYALLEDLNTRPRTTYLGRLRNPHPLLAQSHAAATETPGHSH